MNIPTYLRGDDQSDYQDQLNQELRYGLSGNGFVVPPLTTVQITSVEESMPIGTLWYNTTVNKLQVKTATGIQTITST